MEATKPRRSFNQRTLDTLKEKHSALLADQERTTMELKITEAAIGEIEKLVAIESASSASEG